MANEVVKHAVVRTDLMAGTDVRSKLVSIEYLGADGNTPTAIDNGNVLKVGALVEGEREIYVGEVPTAETKANEVVLVASVEVMYDERKQNLDEFENEVGDIIRGYRLESGDVFSVTAEALSGRPAKGSKVGIGAGTKLVVGNTNAIGTIIDVEVAGRYTYYVIKVD